MPHRLGMFLVNMFQNRHARIDEAKQGDYKTLSSDEEEKFKEWVKTHVKKPDGRTSGEWIRARFGKQINDSWLIANWINEAMTQKIMWRYDALGAGLLQLPGFGLPLGVMPDKHFPVFVTTEEKTWTAVTLLIREVCMLKLVEELTNKPEWWIKVRNPEIAQRWKQEALQVNWEDYREHADFTPAMADAVINELRSKADMYEKTGLLPVMDYSAAVIKSDMIITDELRNELNAAISPLENVPENQKDWHPGSDGKVLDLVHPSLWPLQYGRSRIVTDKRISLSESLEHCGTGRIIPVPSECEMEGPTTIYGHSSPVHTLSNRFQWLPCDIILDVASGRANIDSYINNLHPVRNAELYPIIEKFVEKSLPAWDLIYRWPEEFETQRLKTDAVGSLCTTAKACEGFFGECRPSNRPLNEDEEERDEDEEWEPEYEASARGVLDLAWFAETHKMDIPDPDRNDTSHHIRVNASHVKSSGFFNNAERLQVIVKLANIHLTPDNPSYSGGTWHVEGQLNEHIVATALYYYDCDNITDCHLDFRTLADREWLVENLHYSQNDHYSIERTFAISDDTTVQDIGSVLTKQGRALFFPNVYMHHVSPFQLADATRPGHRKILALFLVDPAIPVISTANVPPQQKDWWVDATKLASPSISKSKLPPELWNLVVDNVEFPIGLEEAKLAREDLMAERSQSEEKTGIMIQTRGWNFCEH